MPRGTSTRALSRETHATVPPLSVSALSACLLTRRALRTRARRASDRPRLRHFSFSAAPLQGAPIQSAPVRVLLSAPCIAQVSRHRKPLTSLKSSHIAHLPDRSWSTAAKKRGHGPRLCGDQNPSEFLAAPTPVNQRNRRQNFRPPPPRVRAVEIRPLATHSQRVFFFFEAVRRLEIPRGVLYSPRFSSCS